MAPTKERSSSYFVLSCEGIVPGTMVGTFPKVPGPPWMMGHPIRVPVTEPLAFGLDPMYPGELKPFYKGRIPLMRDDLIAALHGAGVDNLQLFKAVLDDPFRSAKHTDYKAFNVIGVIAAADLQKSELMVEEPEHKVDMKFASLAVDEAKIGGPLMFRLAESVNAILVHARVKAAVEAAGIPGMTFYTPEEWAG